MKKNHKNIYMGVESTAKLPVFGKVDTENEIILNSLATAYDALNEIMLTKKEGYFEKTNLVKINGRFSILKMLCRKYSPSKMMMVNKIHNIVIENFKGNISDKEVITYLQNLSIQYGFNPGMINMVMFHINQAEMFDPFNAAPFFMMNNTVKKRGLK